MSAGQGTVPELVAAGLPAIRFLEDQAWAFVRAAKAPSTLRAYRSDWDHFGGWCREHTLCPLPATPDTIALYLTALAATHRAATMTRRLTAITKAHAIAGYPSPATMQQPAVSETLKGIRRTLGTAQPMKAPLLTADIRRMVQGFAGHGGRVPRPRAAARGICGRVPPVGAGRFGCGGCCAHRGWTRGQAAASKTDPEGKGRDVGIPYGSTPSTCPVRALMTWKTAAGISEGALFRGVDRHRRVGSVRLHKDSVGLVVKRAAEAAGLDPAKYAGHSLRAGLATQAYLNGAGELAIMRQTGHRSLTMVRRYIRDGSLFRENPAAKLGL
jgi:hypothetical protein